MNLEVNNTKLVIDNANIISNKTKDIDVLTGLLDDIISHIDTYWATNNDQLVLKNNLIKQTEQLKEINTCNKKFASIINEYISLLEKTGGDNR